MSNLENNYNIDNYNLSEKDNLIETDIIQNEIESINIPIGWSSICFNEAINFYTDYNVKNYTIK